MAQTLILSRSQIIHNILKLAGVSSISL